MRKPLLGLVFLWISSYLQAQVGIGTATPHSSAQLEIVSSNKGLLIPRMSQAERMAISSPAQGLLVYQTDATPGYYYYSGTLWLMLLGANNGWNLTGNAGTTSAHFVGTTDGQPLIFKSGNNVVGKLTPGGQSTAIGFLALKSITSGTENAAFGTGALEYNTSGNANTAVGDDALKMNGLASYNTALGANALYTNALGLNNVAVGYQTLFLNSSASHNTGLGSQALYQTQKEGNTGVGSAALYSNTNGTNNTAVGFNALFSNQTRGFNTAVGSSALVSNTIGEYSTALGAEALINNVSGSNNTALGAKANVATGNLTNATAIGYGAIVDASNKIQVGNSAVATIGGVVSWSTLSDGRFKDDIKEDVPGLAFIKSLRPVTYKLNRHRLGAHYQRNDSITRHSSSLESTTSNKRETGFIAQEVAKAAKAMGYTFSGIDEPTNDSALYGIRYADFVVPLVKAVQEQQAVIDALQQENKTYKDQLKALQERLEKLEAVIHK
jgi:hypothetical protein